MILSDTVFSYEIDTKNKKTNSCMDESSRMCVSFNTFHPTSKSMITLYVYDSNNTPKSIR